MYVCTRVGTLVSTQLISYSINGVYFLYCVKYVLHTHCLILALSHYVSHLHSSTALVTCYTTCIRSTSSIIFVKDARSLCQSVFLLYMYHQSRLHPPFPNSWHHPSSFLRIASDLKKTSCCAFALSLCSDYTVE
jgi:hypothetical protein